MSKTLSDIIFLWYFVLKSELDLRRLKIFAVDLRLIRSKKNCKRYVEKSLLKDSILTTY